MTDYIMLDELDEEILDFDANSGNSDMSKVDSILIKRILSEMKSEFNKSPSHNSDNDKDNHTVFESEELKSNCDEVSSEVKEAEPDNIVVPKNDATIDDDTVDSYQTTEGIDAALNMNDTPNDTSEIKNEQDPELNLTINSTDISLPVNDCFNLSKLNEDNVNTFLESSAPSTPSEEVVEAKKPRRTSRQAVQNDCEVSVKRSSRRMSKENSRESVLQSAIALKEKSFSSLNHTDEKPHRRSTRLVESEHRTVPKLRQRSPRFSWQESTDSTNSCSSNNDNGQKNPSKLSLKSVSERKTNLENPENKNTNQLIDSLKSEDNSSVNLDIKSIDAAEKPVPSPTIRTRRKRKLALSGGSVKKKCTQELELIESNEVSTNSQDIENGQCECNVFTNLFINLKNSDEELFCTAIDSIEKKAVGCDNLADCEFSLMRPKSRVPFMLLCATHIDRMLRHQCCPLCGVFCTRGLFLYCNKGHFYHKDCDPFYKDFSSCAHCNKSETKEVVLSLSKSSNPFFLPSQKVFDKKLSARITVTPFNQLKKYLTEKSELSSNECVVLPSGYEINSSGVPELERDILKKILSVFTTKNADSNLRFTNKNLYQAAKNGEVEKTIQILWSGISPNISMKDGTPLHAAARNGHLAIVHILVQCGSLIECVDKEQYTPLMLAALNGHANIIEYLIKAGADRSFKGTGGMSALHIAAKEGHVESCRHLLSNLSSPYALVNAVDEGNWTALVWAAENRQVAVVRFLLQNKADIQIRDTERNIALHWASLACSLDIIEELLNCGSDINATNVYGDTPLHIAAREGSVECVMLLLSRGAIPDLLNKAGIIARDCTREPNPYLYDLITVSMKLTLVVANLPIFPRILTNDISRGKESKPIQCVNEIDDDGLPSDFVYITENCIATNIQIDNRITSLIPCKCENKCTSGDCVCIVNSKGCWYDHSGKLVPDFNYEDPPLVFECNPACQCNVLTCINRVVQKGIRVSLQMCKTQTKNWGVITLEDIPKGTYVCEYIGEIISDSEADTRHDDSYLFDLDNKESESYCIDARWYGNITRFINHSCRPNLFPVRVFINHQDLRFPRIAFFASRDIPAFEELGFDYGEKFWMIKYKTFTCTCGDDTCRFSDETIQQTIQKYQDNLKEENQGEC